MTDPEFDQALIKAAFSLAASRGWSAVSPPAAATAGDLPLERARARFPTTHSILLSFGRLADEAALTGALDEGSGRERLFDVLMRRIDALQAHRAGIAALLDALPTNPATALLLAAATDASMGWMLGACGISAAGLRGLLARQGLVAVWLATIRVWRTDDGPDLPATMAALDRALGRAEQWAGWLQPTPTEHAPKPFPEPDAQESVTPAT